MDSKSNPLANLANLVKEGRAGTEQRFWQEMSPQLERMVRRVIRFGPGRSALEQRIEREVSLVTGDPGPAHRADGDKIVGLVTRRVFERVLGNLRAAPARPHGDTRNVAAAHDHPTRVEWGVLAASS